MAPDAPEAALAPRRIGAVNWPGCWGLYKREVMKSRKVFVAFSVGELLTYGLYFTVMAFALGIQRETPEGAAVLIFLMPGLISLGYLMDATQTTAFSISYDKIEGCFDDILMAPLGPIELVIAYSASAVTSAIVNGSLVVLAGLVLVPLATGQPMPLAAIWALPTFAFVACFMMGTLGILLGLVTTKWDHLSAALSFGLMPLLFLSGVFAPLERLPDWAQPVMLVNPVHHAVDGIRFSFLGTSQSSPILSLAVMLVTTTLLVAAVWHLLVTGKRLKS